MKKMLMILSLMIPFNTHALTPEDAKQLIEFNEKYFSQKELINNPDLCSFHNSIIKISNQKKEQLHCNGRSKSPETKDQDLVNQMSALNNSMAVMEMQHPESDLSPESIKDYAIQKMISQGFNK